MPSNTLSMARENDRYGNFVPSMAEVGLYLRMAWAYVYTPKGCKWYTSEEWEYAVKAQDFVALVLKYAADKESDGLYLVQESIRDWMPMSGEITDFLK